MADPPKPRAERARGEGGQFPILRVAPPSGARRAGAGGRMFRRHTYFDEKLKVKSQK
jgi:hypothetical protein